MRLKHIEAVNHESVSAVHVRFQRLNTTMPPSDMESGIGVRFDAISGVLQNTWRHLDAEGRSGFFGCFFLLLLLGMLRLKLLELLLA